MLWVLRVAMCAALAVVTAPEAHGGAANDATAVSSALTQSDSAIAKAEAEVGPVRSAILVLPGVTKAITQPLLQGTVVVEWPALIGGRNVPGATGDGSERGTFGESSKWATGNGAGLRYSVSSRVSLGLKYRRVTDETLDFEVAETGSLQSDYDSHNFVVQARWEF